MGIWRAGKWSTCKCSVDYIDPALPHPNEMGDDVDEFEVVTGPDSPTKGNDNVKENSAKTMPKE